MEDKPETITVLGQIVKIKYAALTNNHGDCDVALREIRLNKKLEGEALIRVLRHEAFHMKLGIAGLNELLSSELEEALCALAESD